LRKALKIKTWIIFLSWSIFFVHGLFPHIHDHPHTPGISHALSFSSQHHCENEEVKFACHCEEKGNCNIQGMVFHNTTNDEDFTGIIKDNHFSFSIPDLRISSSGNEIISPSRLPGNIFLRAPPAV
jgi:hypothetical protein